MNPCKKNLESNTVLGIGLTGLVAGAAACAGRDSWDLAKKGVKKFYKAATADDKKSDAGTPGTPGTPGN